MEGEFCVEHLHGKRKGTATIKIQNPWELKEIKRRLLKDQKDYLDFSD